MPRLTLVLGGNAVRLNLEQECEGKSALSIKSRLQSTPLHKLQGTWTSLQTIYAS